MPAPNTGRLPSRADLEDHELRLISLRQPWWFAITELGKDIENRTQAAKWLDGKDGWIAVLESKMPPRKVDISAMWTKAGVAPRHLEQRRGQCIVGMLRIKSHAPGKLPPELAISPWYEGTNAWEILGVIQFGEPVYGNAGEPVQGSQCVARYLHKLPGAPSLRAQMQVELDRLRARNEASCASTGQRPGAGGVQPGSFQGPRNVVCAISPGARKLALQLGVCVSELAARHSGAFLSVEDVQRLSGTSVRALSHRSVAESTSNVPDAARPPHAARSDDPLLLDGCRILIHWPRTRPDQRVRFVKRVGTVRHVPAAHEKNVYHIEFERKPATAFKGARLRRTRWSRLQGRRMEVLSSAYVPGRHWTEEERYALRVRVAAGEKHKSLAIALGRSEKAVNTAVARQQNAAYASRATEGKA